MALEIAITLGLFLLLVGWRTSIVSITLTLGFVVQSGIRFSTGKIDHDILLFLVPLFLASSWGARLALRPEKFKIPRLDIFGIFLGFFFLTSGLQKGLTGWLAVDHSSTQNWLYFYQNNYSFLGPIGKFVLSFPNFLLELLDWATVILECAILPLLLFRKLVPIALLLALSFNMVVYLIFGIDFSKLIPVYLVLLPIYFFPKMRLSMAKASIVVVATALSATINSLTQGILKIGPFSLEIPIFWITTSALLIAIGLTIFPTLKSSSGLTSKPISIIATIGILSIPFVLSVLWTEPYPAVIGPGFRGGITSEYRQIWKKDGEIVDPSDVFQVPAPFSKNIALFGWPSPQSQGHEFKKWNLDSQITLPNGVTVEWSTPSR